MARDPEMFGQATYQVEIEAWYKFDLKVTDSEKEWLAAKWPLYFPNARPSDYPHFEPSLSLFVSQTKTYMVRFKLQKTSAVEVAIRFGLTFEPMLIGGTLEELSEAAKALLPADIV